MCAARSDRLTPLHVSAYTATSAVGVGLAALHDAIAHERSGLRPLQLTDLGHPPGGPELATWVGQVDGLDAPLPAAWETWDCRNHRLAWRALQADGFLAAAHAAVARHGPHRVALVLGTSTGSIGATETAYRERATTGHFPAHIHHRPLHTLHALTAFVQAVLGVQGPCQTVSTACSSSAKAFASAERLLRLGLVDAAIVGGVDSLCGSVLFGFQALQLVSPQPCQPFDVARQGINLGEGGGFALLERGPGPLALLGWGESSDAHHLTAPHPRGLGVEAALDQALARAGLDAGAVDYIHLHGTATPQNDACEAALVARRFGSHTRASSTKGLTGHTLGAAGLLGSAVCLQALSTGLLPGTQHTRTPDPACGPQLLLRPVRQAVRVAACHAFGFGGSNCVLLWGTTA